MSKEDNLMKDYQDYETMDIEEMIEEINEDDMWGYVSDEDLKEYLWENRESIAVGEDHE